jgi:uncharacterized membrane protein
MAKFEASVLINRPIDEVSAYVMDIRNWPKWNSSLPEAEQTSEGPLSVGTTFRGVSQFLGRRMEWTSVVTEYEPNRKIGQKIAAGPMSMEQTLILEPVGAATRFTLESEGEFGGLFKLAEAIVNRQARAQMESNLAELKKTLEGSAQTVS